MSLSTSSPLNPKRHPTAIHDRPFVWPMAAIFSLLLFPGIAPGQTPLDHEVPIVGQVAAGEWAYFYVDIRDAEPKVGIAIKALGVGNPDLYIRQNRLPDLENWDFRPFKNTRYEWEIIDESSVPPLATGRYYIGVHGRTAARFGVGARWYRTPSQHSGMGAIALDNGAAFRVWAPNAEIVSVVGTFNGWSSTAAPLVSEGNGNWSADLRSPVIGDHYQYVFETDGQQTWKTDARSRDVVSSAGNSIIADPDFDWQHDVSMPPWNELVLYEMHIGTFNDTPGSAPGDFYTAIDRLDHLADLGINAIELMPVCEFAGDYSWGYNPSQPYAIESSYGHVDGYRTFIDEAHARGIIVIQDVVYNHLGPDDLDLWQYDGWSLGPEDGGIYFFNDDRRETPWGNTRPNFERLEVRQFIRDNALMWLEDYRADGLRIDGTAWIRLEDGFGGNLAGGWSLLQWINDEINARQPWKFVTAEDMRNNEWLTKGTGVGGAGFDAQWTAQFVHPIRAALEATLDESRDMYAVRDAINHRFNGDAFERIIYTESHDEVSNGRNRLPEDIWPGDAGSWHSRKRSTLGAALVMTSPGVPMIFQGQEFLEDGWFDDDRPLDWTKLDTYAGIHRMYGDLIRLRRNWHDNTRGLRGQNINTYHVNNDTKVLAFHRWENGGPSPGDDVVVVANFSDQTRSDYTIGFPGDGTWHARFNSDSSHYSDDFGNFGSVSVTPLADPYDGMPYQAQISIAPYSILILSL